MQFLLFNNNLLLKNVMFFSVISGTNIYWHYSNETLIVFPDQLFHRHFDNLSLVMNFKSLRSEALLTIILIFSLPPIITRHLPKDVIIGIFN